MYGSLQHVGVLGMHWGRRKSSSAPSVRVVHPDHAAVQLLKKKKLHEMSNDEIRKVATRMQLEKQYRDLNPEQVSKGKKEVKKYLGLTAATAANAVAVGVGGAGGAYLLKLILKKAV